MKQTRLLLLMSALCMTFAGTSLAATTHTGHEHKNEQGTAAKTLQAYVSHLRKALGKDVIVTWPAGYELRLEPARLDGVKRTDPAVTIKPGLLNSWVLRIDGYNTPAKVRRIK